MSISRFRLATGVIPRLVVGTSLLLVSGIAAADYALNFQQPVSSIGREVFDLHNLITIICFVIMALVAGVMLWSIAFHRKSSGRKPATFHDNTKLEVLWTVVPFIILVGMAIPSTSALLHMDDTSNSDMTLKITGYQWKWEYEYPAEGIKFMSTLATPRDQINNVADKGEHYLLEVDNNVVLPVGKKIRLLVTANDVLHAWWVPALATKKDAIPGFINELWVKIDEPGIYRGQCAELCGKDHGFMPIVVEAVSDSDFKKWANRQKGQMVAAAAAAGKSWSKADLLKQGEKVYNQNCAACHGATGAGIPGVFPAMAGSKVANGPVNGHLDIVLHGKAGTAMAAFGKQLSDVDIAAVVTYERNSFGNKTGDVIQPSQAKSLR
ncbi:MAG: cytochrome c oxidase subunit II [Acidiferrobacterales bacterium]|jgi:cytochrome c oxidase subunit 2|nr:cytochrome c oxidase subunit II [Acidiferrobacterales bacterium]